MLPLVALTPVLLEHLALIAGAAGVGIQLPQIINGVVNTVAGAKAGTVPAPVATASMGFAAFSSMSATLQQAFIASGGHVVGP